MSVVNSFMRVSDELQIGIQSGKRPLGKLYESMIHDRMCGRALHSSASGYSPVQRRALVNTAMNLLVQ